MLNCTHILRMAMYHLEDNKASGPITSWQIGEKVEAGMDFILLGSSITVDGDCSHKIKRYLLLGRKAMTNLDGLLKNRDITLLTKVCMVKTMIFSSSHVWIWELDHKEGCVLKNWCFQDVVLKKTLMSPWTARRSNQSILKEISPEYSLEGLILKLKLWYFGHLMRRVDSLEKTLMLGKIKEKGGDDIGWDRWMASPTQWVWIWANSGRWWRTDEPGVLISVLSCLSDLCFCLLWTHTKVMEWTFLGMWKGR